MPEDKFKLKKEPRRVNQKNILGNYDDLFTTPQRAVTGKQFAKNTSKMAELNVLNQALLSLTEGIGLSQGAPIEKRKDSFAPTALASYQNQIARNSRNDYVYDLMTLRQEQEQARRKQRELENANRNNLMAAIEEFRAGTNTDRDAQKATDASNLQGEKDTAAFNRVRKSGEDALERTKYREDRLSNQQYPNDSRTASGKLSLADKQKAIVIYNALPEERKLHEGTYDKVVLAEDLTDNQLRNYMASNNISPSPTQAYNQPDIHAEIIENKEGSTNILLKNSKGELINYDLDDNKNGIFITEDGTRIRSAAVDKNGNVTNDKNKSADFVIFYEDKNNPGQWIELK